MVVRERTGLYTLTKTRSSAIATLVAYSRLVLLGGDTAKQFGAGMGVGRSAMMRASGVGVDVGKGVLVGVAAIIVAADALVAVEVMVVVVVVVGRGVGLASGVVGCAKGPHAFSTIQRISQLRNIKRYIQVANSE